MYWVYSHPIRRGYAARLCSWAMFVQLLVFGFLLTIPYLAAYRSGGEIDGFIIVFKEVFGQRFTWVVARAFECLLDENEKGV